MTSNHKLSALLQGRAVSGIAHDDTQIAVTFTDGSTMTVQTGGAVIGGAPGAVVRAVRQSGTALALDFEDGAHLQITTAEQTSSVLVRDKSHVLEYAD